MLLKTNPAFSTTTANKLAPWLNWAPGLSAAYPNGTIPNAAMPFPGGMYNDTQVNITPKQSRESGQYCLDLTFSGTHGGADYIYYGFNEALRIGATQNQVCNLSVNLEIISGSSTISAAQLYIDEYNAAGTWLATTSGAGAGITVNRFPNYTTKSDQVTVAQASCASVVAGLVLGFTASASANWTLRLTQHYLSIR